MTDITRDEFIKAVREIRPPMFSAPERQGFFLRNLDGEFTAPGLEAAYVGWCLGRESQGVEANLFIIDGMDYTEVDEQEIALYHAESMTLDSEEVVTVERWHKLKPRDMKISVDADGCIEWEWVEGQVTGGE